jgi:hypothetical protein
MAFNDAVNGPVVGKSGVQALGDGSIATNGNVRVEQVDERNYGTSLERVQVGAGGTVNVTTADPALAAAAIQANSDTARAALVANLAASQSALAFGGQTVGLAAELAQKNKEITTQTINASLDQAREAAARSESVVQSALSKLADQRAPDGANLTKVVLWIVGALAVVLGLSAHRSKKS